MNLALVLFITSVGLFALAIWSWNKLVNFYKYENTSSVLCVLLAIGLFGGSMITWNTYFRNHIKERESHYYYIKSLGNDTSIKGDFILGSGNIQEKEYYFFYVNMQKGMKKLKLPIHNTYIVETNDRVPEAIKVKKHIEDEDLFFKNLIESESYHYILYVPKETIIRDFKVR